METVKPASFQGLPTLCPMHSIVLVGAVVGLGIVEAELEVDCVSPKNSRYDYEERNPRNFGRNHTISISTALILVLVNNY